MKDDEYFGFSVNDDSQGVNLLDEVGEDNLKIVDQVKFDTEDDVRIVSLDDVEGYTTSSSEQFQGSKGSSWLERIEPGRRKADPLPSSSGLRQRCTRKRHMLESAVVAGFLVVVLVAFFVNSPLLAKRGGESTRTANVSSSVSNVHLAPGSSILAPSNNEAALIIDATHYYIQFNPNWEQVLLDGHSLLALPIPGVDPPLRISAGQHLIMWRTNAQQFYSCTMSVPPTLTDTCVYNGPEPLQNGVAVWIIAHPHFEDGD